MQRLLNEIARAKADVKASISRLEKIDTSQKNAGDNRDRSIEGRIEIKNLTERVINLRQQMDVMTKESDPTWPSKTFDEAKRNAFKTLLNLTDELTQVDKHLVKATGATSDNTQSIVDSSVSTDDENTKGIGSLVSKLPLGGTKKTRSTSSSGTTTPDDERTTDDDDDDDVRTNERQETQRSLQPTKKTEPFITDPNETDTSSDESEESEDEDDGMGDNHQLLEILQKRELTDDHRSQTSTPLNISKQSRTSKVNSTQSTLPIVRKTSSASSSSRQKTRSSKQRIKIPITKKDEESDDSLYTDEDEDELRDLHDSSNQEVIHNDDQTEEEDEPIVANTYVQKLRMGKYAPGTQFRVIHNLNGIQIDDLTIHKDEILILVEQRADDWWLFKNPQTQQQGMVPINHIELQSKIYETRHRIKPFTSTSTLVNAFKTNNYIPTGFVASDLAPLIQLNKYKLYHTLIPKMTESNFAFADLHWRYDLNQIHVQQVYHQKILSIKKCLKIPKVKGDQIHVLDRCIRVCLYDGYEIVSNIHTIRARISNKMAESDLTEDWYFASNNKNTFFDEQTELLIRSNEYDGAKQLYLLIELSQLCQSKTNEEKCEIGSGWTMILFDDDQPPLMSETKSYNELLHGGHIHETNILLDSRYQNFHSNGLSGKINRYKKARIRFSFESRENHMDVLYDNLPITSMIVPLNLVRILVFYRNELAYQLSKTSYSNNLSTKTIDSIFLSTFYQTLEQPDIIYTLNRLYRLHKKLSFQEQREEFIKIYERFIYPLFSYRLLPLYDIHNITSINQRRILIRDMTNQQLRRGKPNRADILSILLDPNLTDKWTPFTTDETCFSLQKYTHDLHLKQ